MGNVVKFMRRVCRICFGSNNNNVFGSDDEVKAHIESHHPRSDFYDEEFDDQPLVTTAAADTQCPVHHHGYANQDRQRPTSPTTTMEIKSPMEAKDAIDPDSLPEEGEITDVSSIPVVDDDVKRIIRIQPSPGVSRRRNISP